MGDIADDHMDQINEYYEENNGGWGMDLHILIVALEHTDL